mmetsp:Transcript_10353/g.22414  ORF Transcript_10353/g.22414 Transcript_10353/m.22414 type:complete len:99 (+) Transcript_10353:1261-1557(+)
MLIAMMKRKLILQRKRRMLHHSGRGKRPHKHGEMMGKAMSAYLTQRGLRESIMIVRKIGDNIDAVRCSIFFNFHLLEEFVRCVTYIHKDHKQICLFKR